MSDLRLQGPSSSFSIRCTPIKVVLVIDESHLHGRNGVCGITASGRWDLDRMLVWYVGPRQRLTELEGLLPYASGSELAERASGLVSDGARMLQGV